MESRADRLQAAVYNNHNAISKPTQQPFQDTCLKCHIHQDIQLLIRMKSTNIMKELKKKLQYDQKNIFLLLFKTIKQARRVRRLQLAQDLAFQRCYCLSQVALDMWHVQPQCSYAPLGITVLFPEAWIISNCQYPTIGSRTGAPGNHRI